MAVVAALVGGGVAAIPVAQAVAQDDSTNDQEAWRQRLISEFSAALTRGKAPENTCLSLRRNGEELLAVKADKPLIPASLNKITTSAAALAVMGPDATYTTEVVVGAVQLAEVRAGVLTGDVYLVGGGDPVLSTEGYISRLSQPSVYTDAARLADAVMNSLRAAGVTRIEGSIVGDGSWYADTERDYTSHSLAGKSSPVWKKSYVEANLVGPLSGLIINDGYARYGSSRRSHVRASDPPQAAASLFDDLLEARGMVITKRPRSGTAPATSERASLGQIRSPPLSQILNRVLAMSDNTTAEMLLKEIGRRTTGSDRASAAAGAGSVVTAMLGDAAEGVVIVDGSGLSVHNRLTCRALTVLLTRSGADSPLYAGLGVAGKTGTLRNCSPAKSPDGEASANSVMIKSGVLNDSRSLAGATLTASRELLTFAMIANKSLIITWPFCPTLQRQLLTAASQYTYGPSPLSSDTEVSEDQWPLFDDVTGGVHRGSVEALAMAGVTPGCSLDWTRFCPEDPVTRGQLALFLARMMGLESSTEKTEQAQKTYQDVTDTTLASAVSAVTRAGIMPPCSVAPATFCADGPVPRVQLAIFLTRALDLPVSAVVDGSRFGDVDDVATADVAAIEAIATAGITRGCDRDGVRFCPERNVTRAQAATFLARAFKQRPSS